GLVSLGALGLAERGIAGVPGRIVADVEVEVAVVVEVGEGGRRRPVAVAAQPGARRDIPERAIALVAIERVGAPAGDEEVRVAIVVDVADGDAVAVAAGHPADPGGLRDVLERAIAPVAEEAVAGPRPRLVGGEGPPLD